jgi:hypothetical protein
VTTDPHSVERSSHDEADLNRGYADLAYLSKCVFETWFLLICGMMCDLIKDTTYRIFGRIFCAVGCMKFS